MIDTELLNETATVYRLPDPSTATDDYGNLDDTYAELTTVAVRVEIGRSQQRLVIEPRIGRGWSTVWLATDTGYEPREYDRLDVPNSGVHQVALVILWSGIDAPNDHYELVCELVTP